MRKTYIIIHGYDRRIFYLLLVHDTYPGREHDVDLFEGASLSADLGQERSHVEQEEPRQAKPEFMEFMECCCPEPGHCQVCRLA